MVLKKQLIKIIFRTCTSVKYIYIFRNCTSIKYIYIFRTCTSVKYEIVGAKFPYLCKAIQSVQVM